MLEKMTAKRKVDRMLAAVVDVDDGMRPIITVDDRIAATWRDEPRLLTGCGVGLRPVLFPFSVVASATVYTFKAQHMGCKHEPMDLNVGDRKRTK